MKTGNPDTPARPLTALVVQDSIFRAPQWNRLLTEFVSEWMLVRFHDSIEELMECASRFDRAIALVDSALLENAESKATELLRASGSLRMVVRVSDAEPEQLLERMLLVGCYSFVTDRISPASLKRVLRGVDAGEIIVSRRLLSRSFQRLLAGRLAPKLSRREQDVLALLGQGLSNRSIAERLFISPETLRWHLRNLYSKTELKSRNDLIEYATSTATGPTEPVRAKTFTASGDGM
jgi:DNA-binding NarL/FixJ family response regulator